MRTPVKEGQSSPVRGPASESPVNRSKPHTQASTMPAKQEGPTEGKAQLPSPVPSHQANEGDYADDFEQGTHENVSSLEEDKQSKDKKGFCFTSRVYWNQPVSSVLLCRRYQ